MNAASRVIITIMSVLTIAAILAGLYIHVFGKKQLFIDGAVSVSDTVNLDGKVDEISVDMDYADLSIETGDDFSVEYNLPDKPQIDLQNGKLTVKSKVSVPFNGFNMKPGYKIEVVIPEGSDLKNLDLEMDAGKVSVEGIRTKKFRIHSDAGDIDLDDIKADAFEIDTDAGNIEINELETEKMKVDADAGNLKVKDSTIDSLDAHIDAGNIEVHDSTVNSGSCKTDFGNVSLNGNIGDVRVKSSVGNAEINGK